MNQQNTNTEDTIDLKELFFADRSVEAYCSMRYFKRCICSTLFTRNARYLFG